MSDIKKPQLLSRFNAEIKNKGIALSNYYGIHFFNANTSITGVKNWNNVLTFFCDEVNIPGLQLATSDYRINGMPQFQYAHSNTYNDITMSFILDGGSLQKSTLDGWLNNIYEMSMFKSDFNNLGRVKYPDEYCVDIGIIKYEKYGNGNSKKTETISMSVGEIDPFDLIAGRIKSFESRAVYSVRLIDAFPKSVSSLPLSSASSQLLRMSVNFNYKYHIISSLEGDTIENSPKKL